VEIVILYYINSMTHATILNSIVDECVIKGLSNRENWLLFDLNDDTMVPKVLTGQPSAPKPGVL